MFQGQPVADLTPARSESQLRQALDKLLAACRVQADGEIPPQDIDAAVGNG